MGVVFVLAVDYFILLLSLEEIESLLEDLSSTKAAVSQELDTTQESFVLLQQQHQEAVESLQETIDRLKEEAELRRIERSRELESLEWIQSEIEMLTSQKDLFISETREAKRLAFEKLAKIEELEAQRLEDKVHLIAYQEKVLSFQVQNVAVKNSAEEPSPQVESCYKQLRLQFEEKSKVLSQTRRDLFQAEGRLIALEKENALEPECPLANSMQSIFMQADEEIQHLEEEILSLEGLLSQVLS